MRNRPASSALIACSFVSSLMLFLSSCSMDILPVGKSRVLAAKRAKDPLPRGPSAPGAFVQAWDFSSAGGFLLDPARIEVTSGIARLKPVQGSTSGFRAEVLQTPGGHPFATLHGFAESLGPGNQGQIRYQLSKDGSQWYHHDGKQWSVAGPKSNQANTAAEINAQIGKFDIEVGPGTLYVKAFLIAPNGTEPIELKQIKVEGVAPPTDSWD